MFYLGIDIGGTNIAVGIVDENYKIVKKASNPTSLPRSSEDLCDAIYQTGMKAIREADLTIDDIQWVGVGCPGTIDRKAGTAHVYVNKFPFNGINLRDELNKRFGIPCFVENDANAAAYGEALAGATKDVANSVAITLGTGVGSGIIIDGKIYNGFNFAGAEIGHTVIVKDGRPCSCGRRGCWEAYASATGLIRETRHAMLDATDSLMWKMVDGHVSRVTGRTAFDAMREGDPTGTDVVEKYIEYIGCGIVNIINTFQPDIVCIGGGISKEGDTILIPLRKYIVKERYSKYINKQTTICIAKLGNDAGIIGAAYLGAMKD